MASSAIRGHLSFALSGSNIVGDKADTAILEGAVDGNGNFTGQANPATFLPDGDKWWTQPFKAATLSLGELATMLDPEIGNTLFTRGGYKSGAFMTAVAAMDVRLAGYFGKFVQAMASTGLNPAMNASRNAQAAVTGDLTADDASWNSATSTMLVVAGDQSAVIVPGDILFLKDSGNTTDRQERILVYDVKYNNPDTTLYVVRGYGNTTPVARGANTDKIWWEKRNGVTRLMPNVNNEVATPIVHARRYVPDSTGGAGATEFGFDGKIVSLGLNFPQAGVASAEVNAVFRKPMMADGEVTIRPNATGAGAVDVAVVSSNINGISQASNSLALSCHTNIALPAMGVWGVSSTTAFMGAVLQLMNQAVTPQEGMVLGSYYPQDYTVLSRAGSLELTYKWSDEGLYNALVYGGNLGEWDPGIFYSDVMLTTRAAVNGQGGVPLELTLVFPRVALSMSPPTLMGGKFLQSKLGGVISAPPNGLQPAWMAFLYNDVTYKGLA